jgi:hypothetical protein
LSSPQRAKFFVNQGILSSREDMLNVLRPLLKQTVAYRYERGGRLVARGTGWVERIVVDRPDVSTYFTPIAITLNIDSFEHLEFETRPDQLIVYCLIQGDERVVVEFLPANAEEEAPPPVAHVRPAPLETGGYVQMELLGLDSQEEE